jgi:uncharacterized protein YdbL (DUF1318 family)
MPAHVDSLSSVLATQTKKFSNHLDARQSGAVTNDGCLTAVNRSAHTRKDASDINVVRFFRVCLVFSRSPKMRGPKYY